ncbi:MAG TPA: sugar transferase [Stenomitos sp.]
MSSKVLHTLPVMPTAHATLGQTLPQRHTSLVGLSGAMKRAIDVLGASLGLLLLAPLFLVLVIAIKLDSPGPALFRQRRVGLDGREFEMYKFRSMSMDAEARKGELLALNEVKDGPIFKMRHDPRITRVGRFIRRTSLDEFPQLLNILMGQMSLVGPRPPLPSEVLAYTSEQRQRLMVLPGATGLWQVSGRSDLGSFHAMVALDLAYMNKWSLWLDLKILIKTIGVVLRMEGAC